MKKLVLILSMIIVVSIFAYLSYNIYSVRNTNMEMEQEIRDNNLTIESLEKENDSYQKDLSDLKTAFNSIDSTIENFNSISIINQSQDTYKQLSIKNIKSIITTACLQNERRIDNIEKIRLKDLRSINFINNTQDEYPFYDFAISAYVENSSYDDSYSVITLVRNIGYGTDSSYEYVPLFSAVGYVDYEFIDFDDDGLFEFIFYDCNSGNQSSREFISIYSFKDTEMKRVFHRGITETYGAFPYSYWIKHSFVPNSADPLKTNIKFEIHTEFHDSEFAREYFDYNEYFNNEIPEPVDQTVTFTFDGNQFIPDKEVYDYRKYMEKFSGVQ
jgi:hypothetical protein